MPRLISVNCTFFYLEKPLALLGGLPAALHTKVGFQRGRPSAHQALLRPPLEPRDILVNLLADCCAVHRPYLDLRGVLPFSSLVAALDQDEVSFPDEGDPLGRTKAGRDCRHPWAISATAPAVYENTDCRLKNVHSNQNKVSDLHNG